MSGHCYFTSIGISPVRVNPRGFSSLLAAAWGLTRRGHGPLPRRVLAAVHRRSTGRRRGIYVLSSSGSTDNTTDNASKTPREQGVAGDHLRQQQRFREPRGWQCRRGGARLARSRSATRQDATRCTALPTDARTGRAGGSGHRPPRRSRGQNGRGSARGLRTAGMDPTGDSPKPAKSPRGPLNERRRRSPYPPTVGSGRGTW
jgi:hypothetical protein